ncbi:hypothetical protein ACEWY4_015568 [Coilia grayii]|uniref:Uncharacterized protein n=1 Tax=Coilia grayii TaxID=363190 RepID=A0ABD1JNG7_9TELE
MLSCFHSLFPGRQSPLCVVLTAAGGGYANVAAAARAIAAGAWFIEGATFTDVLAMAEGIGEFGVALLVCCTALGIALWSAALGIRLATGASGLLRILTRTHGCSQTLMMSSVGPLVVLGASGTGALLGTAAGSVLLWGTQELVTALSVLLLVSCIMMKALSWRFMAQLIVFLIMQFIVMFSGMVLSFAHPGAYILMLIMTWAVTGFPSWLCTLAQKLLRHLPGRLPLDSGDFLVYSFCMVVMLMGFVTGTTAFFLTFFKQKSQQATEILLFSCAHSTPLCATILGAVIGIYFMPGLKPSDAERVALGAVATAMVALRSASLSLDGLGPGGGTSGLLLGVASAAGLSLEAAVVAAKLRYGGPGAAGTLCGAIGGAVLGVTSLSAGRKMLLLSVTALVAVMPNLDRVEPLGHGGVGGGEVKDGCAVQGAVVLGVAAFAMGATGMVFILIGLRGNAGFVTAIIGSLVAIIYSFIFTLQ